MDPSRLLERYASEYPAALAPRPSKAKGQKRWTACPCGVCGRKFPSNHPMRGEWEALCHHLTRIKKRISRAIT